ncbi:hypothetical protein [Mesorhizobium sp.]|uniref:hypothetical protein n=1 Tax=Mesorhizobium sp. TaxID=1871066 RepID=UPI000FE4568A|nr:hypothetical protein [Mesorhizobium sp.]RWP58008.1 MAG: hypothetical protein EOR08_28830 [Mesorhizobium sp.]
MSVISNRSVLLAVALATLTIAGFWLATYLNQPAQLPTFSNSVAKSVEERVASYGAEGFRKKNEHEFRDALANFQKNGPKAPGAPQ